MRAIMVGLLYLGFNQYVSAECLQDTEVIGAYYQITDTRYQMTDTAPSDIKSVTTQHLNFWRSHQQVAYEYKDKAISEVWNQLSNGRIRLVRYFDAHQQGIEYQPNEVNKQHSNAQWDAKNQIISQQLLDQMQVLKSNHQGCEKQIEYYFQRKKISYEVSWMVAYHLPKRIKIVEKGYERVWNLKQLVNEQTIVKQLFVDKDQYRMTDYADIGDNESNPFIRKMINLGFAEHGASGIYDIEGNSLPLSSDKSESVEHHH